jgi:hypothetical protein
MIPGVKDERKTDFRAVKVCSKKIAGKQSKTIRRFGSMGTISLIAQAALR